MIRKIFTIVLLVASFLAAQDEYKPWVKAERERFVKTRKLSKVMYPGDSKIDVTYYGLDLNITTNPNYLSGNVTIGVKADTTSINTCFLDFMNILIVDSILLNGTVTTYSQLDSTININLDLFEQ